MELAQPPSSQARQHRAADGDGLHLRQVALAQIGVALVEEAGDDEETGPLFERPEGDADDLKKISGVGPVLEGKLNELGITRFDQIASLSDEEIERVDARLNFKGRIQRDDWINQAQELAKG